MMTGNVDLNETQFSKTVTASFSEGRRIADFVFERGKKTFGLSPNGGLKSVAIGPRPLCSDEEFQHGQSISDVSSGPSPPPGFGPNVGNLMANAHEEQIGSGLPSESNATRSDKEENNNIMTEQEEEGWNKKKRGRGGQHRK